MTPQQEEMMAVAIRAADMGDGWPAASVAQLLAEFRSLSAFHQERYRRMARAAATCMRTPDDVAKD